LKLGRSEVFDEVEKVFKGANLVRRIRTLEYLLSGLDIPPSTIKWINPLPLALLCGQELEAPAYYTIGVKYPDGRVLTESYYTEDGGKGPEIMLSVEEAQEMLHLCLAALMRELSGTNVV